MENYTGGVWSFGNLTDAAEHLRHTGITWLGSLVVGYIGLWIDSVLLLVFGGIPWQVCLAAASGDENRICSHKLIIMYGTSC